MFTGAQCPVIIAGKELREFHIHARAGCIRGSKRSQTVSNGPKRSPAGRNGKERSRMARKGHRRAAAVTSGPQRSATVTADTRRLLDRKRARLNSRHDTAYPMPFPAGKK